MNRLTNGRNHNRKRKSNSRVKQNTSKIVRNKYVRSASSKKRYNSRKASLGLRLRKNAVILMLMLCAIVFLFVNKNNISAYFTSIKETSNVFSIDAYYDITFYSNDGSGQTETQTISYNVPTHLIDNPFNYDGYRLASWNTQPDGSGTSYSDKEEVNNIGDIDLFAQWEEDSYTVTFDKNSERATGTMENQIIRYDVATTLSENLFALDGFLFAGWNTKADGTGTSYTDKESVTDLGNITLYAQWRIKPLKYAVQIYGINEDKNEKGETLGLTFGPATGDNYNNKYVTHRYEETAVGSGVYNVIIVTHTVAADGTETTTEEILKNSSENNVIRTSAEKDRYDKNIHSMTWSQIAAVQNKEDFLDCMLCGDTKAVEIVLNSELDKGNSYTQNGDGAGFLEESIKNKYIWWNPTSEAEPTATNSDEQTGTNGTDAGGYSSSHMRATLIGFNDKTDVTYAGSTNLTASNSLYSCINEELKSVITSKKVKYVTGNYKDGEYILNDDIADKIWLFSSREIGSIATYGGKGVEGLGDDGHSYGKFSNTDSHFYLEPNFSGKTTKRGCYREDDKNNYYWWLRTPYLISSYNVSDVGGSGSISYGWSGHGNGIAFGFCIDKAPINYTVKFDPNGGTGEMADQPMKSNTKVALRENAFTYEEKAFIGWNTKADGSGTSYADKEEVSNLASTEGAIVTLYAQWRRTGDPKKGDYVAYHPVASEIDSSYTDFQSGVLGYTASDHIYHVSNNYLGLSSIDSFEYNNEFTQEDLRWRIWDIDSEKVRLVPETSTQQKLGIKNTVGFNNGLFLMNDICSKLYAGEVDGITAKSLTYKDIEEKAILKYASSHSNASGYVNNAGKPIWSLENIRNIFGLDSTYGQDFLLDRTNSTTRRFIPTILANESFNKTTTDATSTIYLPLIDMENDYANGTTYNPPTATSYWQGPDSATPGTGRPIMLKQTYYTVSDSPDAYLDSIDKSLVFTGNNYWVASKSLKYTNTSTPYFQFYVRLVSDRNTLTQYVLSSTNNQTGVTGSTLGTDGYGLRLRPIVTIDRSKFNFVDGGTEWNITSH